MAERTEAAKAKRVAAAIEEFCAQYPNIDDCRERVKRVKSQAGKPRVEEIVESCNSEHPNVKQEDKDKFELCVNQNVHIWLQPLLDIYYPAGGAAAPAPGAPQPAPAAQPAPVSTYSPAPAPVAVAGPSCSSGKVWDPAKEACVMSDSRCSAGKIWNAEKEACVKEKEDDSLTDKLKIDITVPLMVKEGIHRTGDSGTGNGLDRFESGGNITALLRLASFGRGGVHAGATAEAGFSTVIGDTKDGDIKNAKILHLRYGPTILVDYSGENYSLGLETGLHIIHKTSLGEENDTGSIVTYTHEFEDAYGGPGLLNFQVPLLLRLALGPFVIEGGINLNHEEYDRSSGPSRAYFKPPIVEGAFVLGVDVIRF